MYSCGPPHTDVQKQDDQHELTYSNYVRTQDVTLKTCRRRWMIGRSGERGSGISVLAARYDDEDDDDDNALGKRGKYFVSLLIWIELPRLKNAVNTCAWLTETLDCCFDFIRSHQQYIPWSPPLEIEPATTECRAETLPLSHQSESHTSDAKSTNHGNRTAN